MSIKILKYYREQKECECRFYIGYKKKIFLAVKGNWQKMNNISYIAL